MDNASKALIIAGAILIAVMLVSLGVMLYNTAAGVAESTTGTVEALGIEGFNAQFNQYTGSRKNATIARGLVDKVIANNQNGDTTIDIYSGDTNKGSDKTSLTTYRASITSKNTVYNISVRGYDDSGAINALKIEATGK